MTWRNQIAVVSAIVLTFFLCGCGGGSSSTSGGNGGGGGTGGGGGGTGGSSGASISLLAPSSMMTGIPLGEITIFGTGLSDTTAVLLDGAEMAFNVVDSGTVQAQLPDSLRNAVGVHQFSVQSGGSTTNSLPFTVDNPQQGPQVMQAIPGFLVGNFAPSPTFIVAADTNGDGLADVIVTGPAVQNSPSIAILDGQSDGTLSVPQYVQVSATPYTLAAGDVDGDGNVDLVSISSDNASSTTVNVLLGDGRGNFQQISARQSFSGIFPGPAYLVDLDGDGKPDLVLATENTSSVGSNLIWLKNVGNGSFAAPVSLAALSAQTFSIADFNGDGKPDLLYTASGSPNALHFLFNQGGGSFKDQAVAGLNGIVGPATVTDFNLDGIPDLVIQVQQTQNIAVYSFAGKGDGSFTQVSSTTVPIGPIEFVTGDFDHDGFPDLVGPSGTEPSELFYLFGDGHGNFTVQQVVGPEGFYVATGDFNGDGLPDVVVPDRFNFVSLALGRTDRNYPSAFALSPATIDGLSAGDINGDGLPDLFIGGASIAGLPGNVFLNQGNDSFQFAANTDPSSFMAADLTGRRVVDLIGQQGSSLVIWPNNGTADFSSSPITTPAPAEGPLTVADMDGDGHPDIVAPGVILYGNGSYQFTAMNLNMLPGPYVIGSFTGSGRLDIASGADAFINMGNRTFQQVVSSLPLQNGALAVVGDFNGDGKDDVAINLPGDGSIAIYYSRGDGTFYQATQVDPGQIPKALAAGDFNGDGKVDLAVGLELSQQACIFFNSGNGQFTRSFFASGADTTAMIAADFNHNGRLDLVFANFLLDFEPPNVDVVFHK